MVEEQRRAEEHDACSVELHFTPEPGDYVQAMRAFLWRDVRVWIVMGLAGLVLAVGIASLVTSSPPTLANLLLLLFPLGLAAYLGWGWPLSVGRRAQRDRRLRSPTMCQVCSDRLLIRNILGESSLEWTAFHRFVEARAHYLLVFTANRRTFLIIPRRAFASAEQEAVFRDIVARHLPGRREPSGSR